MYFLCAMAKYGQWRFLRAIQCHTAMLIIIIIIYYYYVGADIRSVCTEAGMFAIRARRKVCFIMVLSL